MLIYYSNISRSEEGKIVADNTSKVVYHTESSGLHGPITAITKLPTKSDWNNVSLINKTRAILTNKDTNSTPDGNLPTDFSYISDKEIYASRLLTYQEVLSASGNINNLGQQKILNKCNYFLENTKYSSSSVLAGGYWLETVREDLGNRAFYVNTINAAVSGTTSNWSNDLGVRPVIELYKTNISY